MYRLDTKRKMYEHYYAGRLGNKPRTWKRTIDLIDSDYRGLISIRSLQISNPVRKYHVPYESFQSVLRELHRLNGIEPEDLTFVEAPDDTARSIQGEYDGYHLTYSFEPLPMRLAMDKDTRHARGVFASVLLKVHLDPVDYDWLQELLVLYPDHTIEFSGFTKPVGELKTKMLVWEVRAY